MLLALLHEEEHDPRDRREHEEAEHLEREDVVIARDRKRDEHRHQRDREKRGAREIDIAPRGLVLGARDEEDDGEDGEDPDGDVDVKDPAPADVVRQVAADRRPDDRGKPEDTAEDALHARADVRRKEVGERREHAREEDAAEDALDRAEGDELGHVLRLAAERRREDEADHAHEQEWLSPEEIAKLARDRRERRRGHHVAGRDPRVELESVELGHDAWQSRTDDRLVQRGEEECESNSDRREDLGVAGHLTGHGQPPCACSDAGSRRLVKTA